MLSEEISAKQMRIGEVTNRAGREHPKCAAWLPQIRAALHHRLF